jgi:hypothetical protein
MDPPASDTEAQTPLRRMSSTRALRSAAIWSSHLDSGYGNVSVYADQHGGGHNSSRRCIRSGVASPACSASTQQFLCGNSLINPVTYLRACCRGFLYGRGSSRLKIGGRHKLMITRLLFPYDRSLRVDQVIPATLRSRSSAVLTNT